MITGRDFVFTGLQPWDIAIGSNAKDIALEISKHNRVLYINTPLDKKTYYSKSNKPEHIQRKKVIDGKAPILRQINSNLWVLDYPFTIWSINFLPDGKLFDIANKINNKKMYSFVHKTLIQLHFKNYILFIDNDIYRSFYAKELLAPIFSIYYRRDNLTTSYWKKHAPRLEPLLCSKCHFVATNSIQLAESIKQYNKKAYDIGQGFNLDNYNSKRSYIMPQDMTNIPHPIIGYVGWITSRRLDADLIYEIAQKCPKYSFVMVGGEDDYFKEHALHSLPNVIFLGEKAFAEVPAYMSFFHVCLNPQKMNEITTGNYPRKIDEYLALGKPIVATKTKAMEMFDGYVWNCSNAKEYIEAIKEALQNKDLELILKREQFAQTHTWAHSVKNIYSYINI